MGRGRRVRLRSAEFCRRQTQWAADSQRGFGGIWAGATGIGCGVPGGAGKNRRCRESKAVNSDFLSRLRKHLRYTAGLHSAGAYTLWDKPMSNLSRRNLLKTVVSGATLAALPSVPGPQGAAATKRKG